jgi:hypothetical protein
MIKAYPLDPQLEQEPPAPPLLHSLTRVWRSAKLHNIPIGETTYHSSGRHCILVWFGLVELESKGKVSDLLKVL